LDILKMSKIHFPFYFLEEKSSRLQNPSFKGCNEVRTKFSEIIYIVKQLKEPNYLTITTVFAILLTIFS
jgi:hypothetical protein